MESIAKTSPDSPAAPQAAAAGSAPSPNYGRPSHGGRLRRWPWPAAKLPGVRERVGRILTTVSLLLLLGTDKGG